MTQEPFSVYVHVPFCAHKCPYCDFNTYAVENIPEQEYTEAVCREIAGYSKTAAFAGRRVRTIFLGGGTPSLFQGESIVKILRCVGDHFPIENDAEISVEANPNLVDASRLPAYQAAGVNRISFGVQSFSEKYLKLLGRNHTAEEAQAAVESARRAGISNVSIDLMYGLPGQTLAELQVDLETASALPITHLSTYSLTIEPGTPFFQRQERGLLHAAPDGVVAEMLESIPQILSQSRFSRYEISNYARADYESRHNIVYWTGGDYLGVGAGAHSYLAQYSSDGKLCSAKRWSTLALPHSYINASSYDKAVSWRESLDERALMFEFFYLGLRKIVGVSRSRFATLFGAQELEYFEPTLHELQVEGFLTCDGEMMQLTTQGIALADSVFERLST